MRHLRTLRPLLLGLAVLLPARGGIEVHPETLRLKPFQATRLIVLQNHRERVNQAFEWDLQPPGAGQLTRPDATGTECMLMAGDTPVPLEIRIRARPAGGLPGAPWTATGVVRVEPSPFRIGARAGKDGPLAFGPLTLVAGETRHLEVTGPAGVDGALVWTVSGPQGGSFARANGRSNTFHASTRILEARRVHIVVTDRTTGEESYLPVHIQPRLPKGPSAVIAARLNPGHTLLSHQMGPGWDLPSLTLVSRPAADPTPAPSRNEGKDTPYRPWPDVRSVCWMEGPVPEAPGGCWIIADAKGLSRMLPGGNATRMALHGRLTEEEAEYDLGDCAFEGLAARPAGSGEQVPRVIALVSRREATRSNDDYLTMPRQYLCVLEPQGRVRPLAGRRRVAADSEGDWRIPDRVAYTGKASQVDFRAVSGLCLDPAGNVYVTDRHTWAPPEWGGFLARRNRDFPGFKGGLRRIDPEGNVVALASPVLEPEPKALALRDPVGLAYDPGQGRLFLVDGERLIRFDPVGGAWEVLLGTGRILEGKVLPPAAAWRFELHTTRGLAAHRGYLFFALERPNGAGDLWAYDPYTDRLAGLVEDPVHGRVHWNSHPGPLSLFAPDLPVPECASVQAPSALAFHGTKALVPLLDGLGMVHLDSDPFGTYLDPSTWLAPWEGKESKHPAVPHDPAGNSGGE